MRILFSLLSTAHLKNYESVVRSFGERGHRVDLITHEKSGWARSDELAASLVGEFPSVSLREAPSESDEWQRASSEIRACTDYVQFLDPRYSPIYRTRAEVRTSAVFRDQVGNRVARSPTGRAALRRALSAAESAVPPSPAVERFVARYRPDVALFTPYVGLSTDQPAYLRASRAIGARTAVCVGSWDHLTSKSLIRPIPDLVTVWNEVARREAVELHGIPPERLVVTGAQCFDHWFTWRARPRDEFCRIAGLDPEQPFVLYTCFSPFKGEPDEAKFVDRWLHLLRASGDPRLERVGVLIRPHPKRLKQWKGVDLSRFGNVVLWPRTTGTVGDDESKSGLFDSIKHSAGVVGINTSTMLEAGIVGRRVHTILLPDHWPSQMGTLHFRYMLEVGGGTVRAARSFGDHLRQLSDSVAAGGDAGYANEGFIESFIRPHGLESPATPRFVDAVERLGQDVEPRRVENLRLAPVARRALAPLIRNTPGATAR